MLCGLEVEGRGGFGGRVGGRDRSGCDGCGLRRAVVEGWRRPPTLRTGLTQSYAPRAAGPRTDERTAASAVHLRQARRLFAAHRKDSKGRTVMTMSRRTGQYASAQLIHPSHRFLSPSSPPLHPPIHTFFTLPSPPSPSSIAPSTASKALTNDPVAMGGTCAPGVDG